MKVVQVFEQEMGARKSCTLEKCGLSDHVDLGRIVEISQNKMKYYEFGLLHSIIWLAIKLIMGQNFLA